MTEACTGQHPPPCADCAIARVRSRPPRIKAGIAEAIASTGNAWRFLGDLIVMHDRRRRDRLRFRWRQLSADAREANRDVVEAFADDLEVVERLVAHLERGERRAA